MFLSLLVFRVGLWMDSLLFALRSLQNLLSYVQIRGYRRKKTICTHKEHNSAQEPLNHSFRQQKTGEALSPARFYAFYTFTSVIKAFESPSALTSLKKFSAFSFTENAPTCTLYRVFPVASVPVSPSAGMSVAFVSGAL